MTELIDPDWLERASCRGMDVNTFFPQRGTAVLPALLTCSGCPVVPECLKSHMKDPWEMGDDGIWGGTTGMQRRVLRRVVGKKESDVGTAKKLDDLLAIHVDSLQFALKQIGAGAGSETVKRTVGHFVGIYGQNLRRLSR